MWAVGSGSPETKLRGCCPTERQISNLMVTTLCPEFTFLLWKEGPSQSCLSSSIRVALGSGLKFTSFLRVLFCPSIFPDL